MFVNQLYRPDILDCIQDRMEHMIARHCKVLFVRFDARFPEGGPHDGGNRAISQLMKTLREFCAYHGVATQYVWAREQAGSAVPHYHVVFLLNGSRVQNPMGLWRKAQAVWGRLTGGPDGLIHFCGQAHLGQPGAGAIMLRRPSGRAAGPQLRDQQQAFNRAWAAAVARAAYLAKTDSKGDAPARVREFGASQL